MRNRDMPVNAVKIGHWDGEDQHSGGLTKLEYAAIHIHAARLTNSKLATAQKSIDEANTLFDELEKQ